MNVKVNNHKLYYELQHSTKPPSNNKPVSSFDVLFYTATTITTVFQRCSVIYCNSQSHSHAQLLRTLLTHLQMLKQFTVKINKYTKTTSRAVICPNYIMLVIRTCAFVTSQLIRYYCHSWQVSLCAIKGVITRNECS